MAAGLLDEQVVHFAHGLELAAYRLLPAAEVETRRSQVENPGKVLVANQLERIVDPLEQAGGPDLELAGLPHRVSLGLPQPPPPPPGAVGANQPVSRLEAVVQAVVDVPELEQLNIGELDHL